MLICRAASGILNACIYILVNDDPINRVACSILFHVLYQPLSLISTYVSASIYSLSGNLSVNECLDSMLASTC